MASKDPPLAGYGRCPICGKNAELANRPFCSGRCSDVDLARWLGGGYAISGPVESDEDGDEVVAQRAGRDAPRDEDGDDG
jgi:endogenous inhibitor of DNA gyrase (YacG/DUF329 family)